MHSFRANQVVVGVTVVLVAAAAVVVAHDQVRRPRLTPELRGYAAARNLGCFSCHGPDGTGGVDNPGSEEKEVPAWDGGNAMMYVENEQEIREWILYGHPERLAKDHDHHSDHDDPSPLLEMPAFDGVISSRELEDLVAYYKVVAEFDKPSSRASEGYAVASRNGCFGCHGPGGLVGGSNPRSFKGYIPTWRGSDYRELVKNEAELRQWILEGGIDRFNSNPIAKLFTARQVIQMPAYQDRLSNDEVDDLVAYIEWLQRRSR